MITEVKPKRVYKRKVVAVDPPVPKLIAGQECINLFGVSGITKFTVENGTNYPSNIGVYAAPSGCGFKILRGNTALLNCTADALQKLKSELEKYFENDVIAATLGDDHFSKSYAQGRNYEAPLLALGFVKAISYPNFQHGKKYKQHMYFKYPVGYKLDGK